MSDFETNISLTIADHENRNKKSFEEIKERIVEVENTLGVCNECVNDLKSELQAIRDTLEVFRQNLMEISNLVEHENVPLSVFEREIRFLKTMIEEFAKDKQTTPNTMPLSTTLFNIFRRK